MPVVESASVLVFDFWKVLEFVVAAVVAVAVFFAAVVAAAVAAAAAVAVEVEEGELRGWGKAGGRLEVCWVGSVTVPSRLAFQST